jgi:branched-chain amino acid transport system ATP-binding protein
MAISATTSRSSTADTAKNVAALELRDINTFYGHIHALKGISLEVRTGEIVTLIGANGAGKTTTLRTISGIIHPRQGEVRLHGERIDRLEPHRIVEKGVCQAPEGRRIFPRMTVLENLEMGAFARRNQSGVKEDLERVLSLFPRLGERLKQKGGTLSGGEQQMLAIGRALMSHPSLLLLDEPSMGLAPMLVETIFQTIAEINRQGVTVLLVEQNALMALNVAHRGYVLETGRIVLADDAHALQQNEQVQKAYLGIE